MKKIYTYLTILLTFLVLQGCDSFLDNKPKGFTIPEYFDDYVKLMNNQSLYRTLDVFPTYLTDDALFGNRDGQSEFALYNKSDEVINIYKFKSGQIFTPGNNDGIWEGAYSNIFVYNAVINNVVSVTDASPQERNRLKAEALIGRSFEYLNLVNIYAKHYDVATAKTDLGVPILLTENVPQTYSRNSVEDVYVQIEKDLNAAVPYLSGKVAHVFRPNQSIGYAFKAKMYLYMGQYENALTNAKEALKVSNDLLDYTLYTTKAGQYGRIITLTDSVEFPDIQDNKENIYTRILNSTSYLFKNVCASPDLQNVYAKNLPAGASDKRFELFYGHGKFNPGSGDDSFPGWTMFAPYIDFNVGFSTPEILLIAAECEARVGTKENAMGYVNTLRDSRITNNTALTASDKDDALRIVLEERRREFALVGITRLIDLKRLNKDSRFAKTITHTADGESWTLPANDPRYIMPLPLNVVNYNPGIPQYDR